MRCSGSTPRGTTMSERVLLYIALLISIARVIAG
jgi:hypothetical protein